MELLPARLLALVFETLAPMTPEEARRRAGLAIETLAATSTRAQRLQLGLALRSLELAPLNALAGGGLTRFSRATAAQRERVLRAWGLSRVPQRRTAFQAWKRLALFLAYADPGPDPGHPANATWQRIGYRPAAPVTDEAGGRLPVSAPEPAMTADVVVVGSGAGGGVVAARLATAGLDVVVLEAGPGGPPPTLEAEAWRDRYLDRGTTATEDLSFTILAGATLGGGTAVNWTTTFAPPDDVRAAWASDHGLAGFDGRETDDDLARLRAELDPRPPTVMPAKDRVILDGASALGWRAGSTERNAGPCTECGSCGFGCARGAKRSSDRVHLAAAAAAGARIVAGVEVTRILSQARGVLRVAARTSAGTFHVRAETVVLAAGALRTPLLLAASGLGAHPQVGRNLRLHPTVAVIALMAHPVDMWLGPLQAASCDQFRLPGPAAADGIGPAHIGFLIESAPPHPGLAAGAISWISRSDAEGLMDRARHWAPLIGILRETGSGRVRRGSGGRAVITYRLAPADGQSARRALVEISRLGAAAGAVELRSGTMPPERWTPERPLDSYLRAVAATDTRPNRLSLFSAHQMGSVRAGADPDRHPADPAGRVRLDRSGTVAPGVYVADGSLLPTAPGVNPMLTIMAIAERVARAVLADRKSAARP
jgi:long-chain-alcohol oxidase